MTWLLVLASCWLLASFALAAAWAAIGLELTHRHRPGRRVARRHITNRKNQHGQDQGKE